MTAREGPAGDTPVDDATLPVPSFTHPRLRELAGFLAERRAELQAAVEAVPPASRGTRPAPDRWSVAEVLEHLAVMDEAMVRMFGPAIEEARAADARETDTSSLRSRLDVEGLQNRTRALEAPERVRPRGVLDAAAAWDALERSRIALLATLAAGDGFALGTVIRPHPLFGPMDLYQWGLLVGAHEARHAAQVREIGAQLREATDSGTAPGG